MTSPTGNNSKGFTFVEVMVALVVLSAGIVGIYKSFFLCVDYLNNLTCRLYASHLIDTKIATIAHEFKASPEMVVDAGAETETVELNNKQIDFHYDVTVKDVPDVDGLFQLTVNVTWPERNGTIHLARCAFISK